MRTLKYFSLPLLFITLLGCQSHPIQPSTPQAVSPIALPHAYSSVVIDSKTNQPIDLDNLSQQLKKYDVIFIGEYHGNHASHLLQMQLQAQLFKQRPDQVLSMEMFERDQQKILNRYLDGEIGEKYLINEAPSWPNYTGSYRPMIEFAKENFIPVIAANAPGDIVRCIGQYGTGYLDLLPADERAWIAKRPFLDDKDYQKKFYGFMEQMRHGKMDDSRQANSYAAQLARDNSMAEAIIKALQDTPGAQILHLNGSFHSEQNLGTVALLKKRLPELKTAVISPVRVENPQDPKWSKTDLTKGDFIYLLRPQPEEYKDANYRRKAMRAMFSNASEKAKTCLMPTEKPTQP